jgi:hypothetical protein
MARLDPRLCGDATEPPRVGAANESNDRLDGPLLRAMTPAGNFIKSAFS